MKETKDDDDDEPTPARIQEQRGIKPLIKVMNELNADVGYIFANNNAEEIVINNKTIIVIFF